jgi:hypothetical protein
MVDPHHPHWYPTAATSTSWAGCPRAGLGVPAQASRLPARLAAPSRRPDAAHRWGLRLLEDPALDARDAHPAWLPGHAMPWCSSTRMPIRRPMPSLRVLAHPRPQATDPRRQGAGADRAQPRPLPALRAGAWPGRRHGRGLCPSRRRCRACARSCARRALAAAKPRPTPAALLELHTLQALDATLAGASLREVAEGLFGADAVADWYSDGGLRSKVRRLVRRGDALMRGGYRRLAQLPPLEKGRFEGDAKRP